MNDTAYIILNFDFYKLWNIKKSNQTLKFDITDKIKVNTTTINKVEYDSLTQKLIVLNYKNYVWKSKIHF